MRKDMRFLTDSWFSVQKKRIKNEIKKITGWPGTPYDRYLPLTRVQIMNMHWSNSF
jgi:hypothetical protein